VVSYFLRYFSSTSTEQISPIPPDLSAVSIRLALLFLLLFASAELAKLMPAEALREAMPAMIDDRSRPQWANPHPARP
jgi:hypothetical protein